MTTFSKQTLSTLVSSGELRPELMALLGGLKGHHELLLSSPGLLTPSGHLAAIATQPRARYSVQRAHACWSALLSAFANGLDDLPFAQEWIDRVELWLAHLDDESLGVRFWHRAPLYTRILSKAKATLCLPGPLDGHTDDGSLELRVELVGTEHERARQWFGTRFEEATDVAEELRACLRACWAGSHCTPEDAYYKVLATYYADVMHNMDVVVDDNDMLKHLTSFQESAYQAAKGILMRYGGVFLADVVGLGKTYIAIALLCFLRNHHGEHAVIVAPPKVIPAWKELADRHKISLVYVSSGKLSDLDQYSDRGVLVVDESHNFRNVGTGRYETISGWLRPDDTVASRKVILLSATPQNNSALDVKHQLRFFPDTFEELPIEAETQDAWFDEVRKGHAKLTDILQHVIVRRTRSYIKENYPDAVMRRPIGPGEYENVPIRFPARISGEDQCLRYSIAHTYHDRLYTRILETLASLKYPLHGLGLYVRLAHATDPRVRGISKAGAAVRGLFKVLLLKRLESSVEAFRTTLGRLCAKLGVAADQLVRGVVQVSRRRRDDGTEADEAEDLVGDTIDVPLALFEEDRLRREIQQDRVSLEELATLVSRLSPAQDAKLIRLRAYLKERPPGDHKTLLFTQFSDTADYIGRELEREHPSMKVVTGRSGGVLSAARRFAPIASNFQLGTQQEINLLVSTDVLSEGVNLQDADTLINYDLHWNPVRLIQRAGRIDRIGSEHDQIHIASFLPESELEEGLGLEAVLRKRIKEFVDVFGEDGAVLPGGEMPDEATMASAFTGAALERNDVAHELDGMSRHSERLMQLRKNDPERLSYLMGMRPGRRACSQHDAKNVIAAHVGSFWQFWSGSLSDKAQLSPLLAFDTLYAHAQSGPRDSGAAEQQSQLKLMESVRTDFTLWAKTIQAQRAKPRLSKVGDYVVQQLVAYQQSCPQGRRQTVDEVLAWSRRGQPQELLSRKGRYWRKQGWTPEEVFGACCVFLRQMPSRADDLGVPEIVVACFGRLDVLD